MTVRLTLRGGNEEEKAPEEEQPEEKKDFDLDAWKRLYSNTADTNTILPDFWAMFDKEVLGSLRWRRAEGPKQRACAACRACAESSLVRTTLD